MCYALIFCQTSQDITSDSDESEDEQPRRKRAAYSKEPASAAPPVPVDVIDLTEDILDPQPRESNTPDGSVPIRRGEQIDLWTDAMVSCFTYNIISPEPRQIIIAESDEDSTPRQSSPLPAADLRIRSPLPPPLPVGTQLLPQILKEEMEEPVIPTPVVAKKRPLHSKPQANHFKSNSKKGKGRIAGFVNLHLPFGYEPVPEVDLGTLDDALRKLGVDV